MQYSENNQINTQNSAVTKEETKLLIDIISHMRMDMQDFKSTVNSNIEKLSDVVNKLVQVEERQLHMTKSYERLSSQLDKTESKYEVLETRVDALEKEAPMNKQIGKWVMTAVFGGLGVLATIILKTIGIL